jgi:hypothetical protein
MSIEAMGGWTTNATHRSFVRSALVLLGSILTLAVPLVLLTLALEQTGTAGPWGVVAAAVICSVAGVSADGVSALLHRAGSPLGAMLGGMMFRLLPPLAVCLLLALQGGGREHLAFVFYLLAFYAVILALDTWWAVQRAGSDNRRSMNHAS